MKQHIVTTADGIDLAVTEAGDGRPVILLHGFPESAHSWRRQLPALADAGVRAIAYDQRGYRGSSKPDNIEDYRLELLVGDIFDLADAMGIDSFGLVGHDWGGINAWTAALTHPERIERLAVLNTPYRGWCPGFPVTSVMAGMGTRFRYVLSFQEPGEAERRFASDPADWLRRAFAGVAGPGFSLSDEDFDAYLDPLTEHGLTGPVNWYRNIDRNAVDYADSADRRVEVPTLMVAVDSDPVLPAALTDGMEQWVSDLETVMLEDCGHWTQQEQPEELNRLLVNFFG